MSTLSTITSFLLNDNVPLLYTVPVVYETPLYVAVIVYPVVDAVLSVTISSEIFSVITLLFNSVTILAEAPGGMTKSISTIPNKSPTSTQ